MTDLELGIGLLAHRPVLLALDQGLIAHKPVLLELEPGLLALKTICLQVGTFDSPINKHPAKKA